MGRRWYKDDIDDYKKGPLIEVGLHWYNLILSHISFTLRNKLYIDYILFDRIFLHSLTKEIPSQQYM